MPCGAETVEAETLGICPLLFFIFIFLVALFLKKNVS